MVSVLLLLATFAEAAEVPFGPEPPPQEEVVWDETQALAYHAPRFRNLTVVRAPGAILDAEGLSDVRRTWHIVDAEGRRLRSHQIAEALGHEKAAKRAFRTGAVFGTAGTSMVALTTVAFIEDGSVAALLGLAIFTGIAIGCFRVRRYFAFRPHLFLRGVDIPATIGRYNAYWASRPPAEVN